MQLVSLKALVKARYIMPSSFDFPATLTSAVENSRSTQKVKMMINNFLLLLAFGFVSAGLGSQPQQRIIGGRNIDIEEAPWQVSLQYEGQHFCGGSIYSARIIITAAHCLYRSPYGLMDANEFFVVSGSELKRPYKNMVAVSAIKHHKKYVHGPKRINYDIGVLKLSSALRISNKIRPIPLAIKDPAVGSQVFATGWGTIAEQQMPVMPENLQGININICEHRNGMPNNVICAGVAGQSVCYGDSGGPLVFKNTLVGVLTRVNQGCASHGFYTSVALYHKWLINAIRSIEIN